MSTDWRTLRGEPDTAPVEAAPDCRIDAAVILGYRTGRTIRDVTLRIGPGAFIRAGSVIYCGSRIGRSFETGHNVIVREENRIGDSVSVWSNSIIDYGCEIGDGVRIHSNVYIAQFTIINEDAFIAPGVMIANDLHPICTECMKGPVIGARARLGINCTIMPRVRIGEDSLIGGGAVVTRDVPDGSVAAGNPARVIGRVGDLKCRWGEKEWAYPLIRKREERGI